MSVLVTPIGRLSFPHLFKPTQFAETNDPQYECQLLIPKSSNIQALRDAVHTAAVNKFNPKDLKKYMDPIKDGDEEGARPEYEGCWVIKFSTKASGGSIAVIGPNKKPITEESQEIYAGCKARISTRACAWEFSGKRGVKFLLFGVQKAGEGEPFSSRGNPDLDFDVIEPELEELTDAFSGEENVPF